MVIKWVQMTQTLKIAIPLKIYNSLIATCYCQVVLQSANHIGHLAEMVEVLELSEQIDCLCHRLDIIMRQRQVHD